MSKAPRKVEYYLADIFEAIEDIENFTSGMEMTDFARDRKTLYAVTRGLEIIGEAVKNIPTNIKEQYPQIPWRQIAGMRDKLIHGYFGIDTELIWNTIKKDIPALKHDLTQIKKEDFS